MIEYGNSLNNTTQFFFSIFTTHLTLMYSHDANALWQTRVICCSVYCIQFMMNQIRLNPSCSATLESKGAGACYISSPKESN